jgi:hypothetical protein
MTTLLVRARPSLCARSALGLHRGGLTVTLGRRRGGSCERQARSCRAARVCWSARTRSSKHGIPVTGPGKRVGAVSERSAGWSDLDAPGDDLDFAFVGGGEDDGFDSGVFRPQDDPSGAIFPRRVPGGR